MVTARLNEFRQRSTADLKEYVAKVQQMLDGKLKSGARLVDEVDGRELVLYGADLRPVLFAHAWVPS